MIQADTPENFVRLSRRAQYLSKPDFIMQYIDGKHVLDLGVVAHSIDCARSKSEQWLHGLIAKHAKSVLGVDLLKEEVAQLQEMGFNIICQDALTMRLNKKFDVVVCGDLIEHVSCPAALLETIKAHLTVNGIALLTTPNPFSINRFFNIIFDGLTHINHEHTCWFCPQTMYQLIKRCGFQIIDFYWLATGFPMYTKRRFWGAAANTFSKIAVRKNNLLNTDFGVVIKNGEPRND